MATIATGKTWTATETLTNVKYHSMVDAATLSGITDGDHNSNTSFIHLGSSAPTTGTGKVWHDTTLGIFRYYDGTDWQPLVDGTVLTNKSGGGVVAGDVVVVDTSNDNAFTTTTTGSDTKVIGVAAETIANNAKGVIYTHGIRDVNMNAAVSRGNFVNTHTVAKQGAVAGSKTVATFGIAMENTGGAGLAKCLLFL